MNSTPAPEAVRPDDEICSGRRGLLRGLLGAGASGMLLRAPQAEARSAASHRAALALKANATAWWSTCAAASAARPAR